MDSDNPTFYLNRAAALMMKRDFQAAILDARKTLQLDPDVVKAYFRIAKCYMNLGNVSESIQQLKMAKNVIAGQKNMQSTAAQIEKELSTSLQIAANLEKFFRDIEDEKYQAALQQLDYNCLLVDPLLESKMSFVVAGTSRLNDVDLVNISIKWRLMRADCFIGTRHLDEANLIATKVLMNDKTNSEALTIRARVQYYLESHPVSGVLALLQNALAYDPDNIKARTLMRKIKQKESLKKEGNDFFSQEQWDSAVDVYTRIIESDEDSVMMKVKILSNRANIGKLDDAVTDCVEAYSVLVKLAFAGVESASAEDIAGSIHSPMFLKIVLRRADCYSKLENYEDAVRDYTMADTLKAGDPSIKRALSGAKKALKMSKRKDYYKILGIERDSTEKEITKGYRKKCLLYHPDRHSTLSEEEKEVATAKFKEVGEAYSVLSDSRKKNMFDSGMDIDGTSASDGQQHHHHGGADMEDLMGMFFSQGGGFQGGSPFGGQQQQQRRRGGGQQFHSDW